MGVNLFMRVSNFIFETLASIIGKPITNKLKALRGYLWECPSSMLICEWDPNLECSQQNYPCRLMYYAMKDNAWTDDCIHVLGSRLYRCCGQRGKQICRQHFTF